MQEELGDTHAWNWNGAFSLGANLVVALMPYLYHPLKEVSESNLGGTAITSIGAPLQTIAAMSCIVAEAIKTLKGHVQIGLQVSKTIIVLANVAFAFVGILTRNPFLCAMGFLGAVAALLPLIKLEKWPFRTQTVGFYQKINTPPKAGAVLDLPNIASQVGSAITSNPWWFAVALLCILRMIAQYRAPSIDRLRG